MRSPHTGNASLAYGATLYNPTELTSAITEMTAACRRAGIGRSSVVVLHADLTDRYVIALLALTEIGCCVVPVHASTPPAVLDSMRAAAAATAIVNDTGIAVCDDRSAATQAPKPLRNNHGDAAYVLFTSGTTGEPKGVVGTRQGLTKRIEWGCRHFFSPEVHRCAIKTNPAFIDSLTEILSAYLSGRAMIVAPLRAQGDLGLLCDFIDSAEIQQITLTPSSVPVLDAVAGQKLRNMRRWIFSGEELRHSWVARIRALSPAAEVINSYGSTEVCGDATSYTLAAGDDIPAIIPIGTPAAGVTITIDAIKASDRDEIGSLPGGAGELWIGGPQVAHGYLSPDSTRFCHTPDGTRWFRTGDIVYESDGLLYYLGRVGDVHKVRGRRVDLTGVAAALESLDGVSAAHAWIAHSQAGTATLRAAVIPDSAAELSPTAIIAALRPRVLPHLVPDRVDIVRWFQRTASGKIDPHRTTGGRESGRPPRSRFATGIQWVIACVLSEAVEDSDVWPTTAFSDVGLDSLLAVRVATDAQRYFGCRVTALDVLSAQTVEQLAQQVPALQSGIEPPAARLVRDGRTERTLLLLHPAIGTCLGYFALLQNISYPGRVVFVEQNEHARTILESSGMDALAVYYAQQAAQLHSEAAIDVAGYSFGALLAPAVAQALRDLGRSVSSLLLIDPASIQPDTQVTHDWALRRVLSDAGYHDDLPDTALDLSAALEVIRAVSGPLALVPAVQLQHWADCLRSNVTRCAGYAPTMPPASTLLVRATQTSTLLSGDSDPLKRLAQAATIVEVDCTHFELLHGESVAHLAASMSEFLTGRVPREH